MQSSKILTAFQSGAKGHNSYTCVWSPAFEQKRTQVSVRCHQALTVRLIRSSTVLPGLFTPPPTARISPGAQDRRASLGAARKYHAALKVPDLTFDLHHLSP